jgi:FkbM family methyltransferase
MYFAVREDYEMELAHLERFVSPGNIVVDAGAGCGIYTVAAAKLVGDAGGRVIAFEPSARFTSVLKRNIELNSLNNVRLYCEALSDREGQARLYHHCRCVANSIAPGDSNSNRFDEVATTTLDSMLKREGIDRIDFLKMDIEGAEELALRGGKLLLAKSPPVIVFEMNPSAAHRFGLEGDGAWRHLQGLQYRFFAFDEVAELTPLTVPPDDKGQWGFRNIIAIHKDDCRRFWKQNGHI